MEVACQTNTTGDPAPIYKKGRVAPSEGTQQAKSHANNNGEIRVTLQLNIAEIHCSRTKNNNNPTK